MNAAVTILAPTSVQPMVAAPPYALDQITFPIPALAEAAGSAPLGGDRELALATVMTARLMIAALSPVPLSGPERMLRAERTRQWLSALTMPQPARMAVLRAIDASIGARMDGAVALRELAQMLAGHLPPHALRELATLAEHLRLYYEQTP